MHVCGRCNSNSPALDKAVEDQINDLLEKMVSKLKTHESLVKDFTSAFQGRNLKSEVEANFIISLLRLFSLKGNDTVSTELISCFNVFSLPLIPTQLKYIWFPQNARLSQLFEVNYGDCYDKDHPFSTYAKFSEKRTFLTPWYAHERVRIIG